MVKYSRSKEILRLIISYSKKQRRFDKHVKLKKLELDRQPSPG